MSQSKNKRVQARRKLLKKERKRIERNEIRKKLRLANEHESLLETYLRKKRLGLVA